MSKALNKIRVVLTNPSYVDEFIVLAPTKNYVEEVLEWTHQIVEDWQEDKPVPPEFESCSCDFDFYYTALENRFEIHSLDEDDCIKFYY